MKSAVLAGALVLATAVPSFAGSDIGSRAPIQAEQVSAGPAITSAQIARFKAALRLRPDQERHWSPVAHVLRAIVREHQHGSSTSGYVSQLGRRAVAFTTSVLDLRRLAAAAKPLIQVLDDEQKMTALSLVQAMGYGDVMAYF